MGRGGVNVLSRSKVKTGRLLERIGFALMILGMALFPFWSYLAWSIFDFFSCLGVCMGLCFLGFMLVLSASYVQGNKGWLI